MSYGASLFPMPWNATGITGSPRRSPASAYPPCPPMDSTDSKDAPRAREAALGAVSAVPAPLWALAVVTWLNSLGSGILWSGIPFVTERQYGFTQGQNLALAIAESVTYVLVAITSGPLSRRLERAFGLTPRGWLGCILVVQCAAALLALTGAAGVVASACILSACGAALWPMMESYVSSGRHGAGMRRALGVFNVTWMSATGAAMLVMAPLVGTAYANLSLLALVPVSLVSLVIVRWFPARPAPHSDEHAHTHVAPSYPFLLRATRFIVPVSYVFVSLLGPVMPFLLRDLAMEDAWKTPMTSTWMFARMATVVVLAYATFWHGRWGALLLGGALVAGGFAAIIMATTPLAIFVGLACFGAGHGVIYYTGLYYAMAVGSAGVDAGGTFEALIGIGYVVGPLAGLAGNILHSAIPVGDTGSGAHTALLAVVGLVTAAGVAPALLPYLRCKQARGRVVASR